ARLIRLRVGRATGSMPKLRRGHTIIATDAPPVTSCVAECRGRTSCKARARRRPSPVGTIDRNPSERRSLRQDEQVVVRARETAVSVAYSRTAMAGTGSDAAPRSRAQVQELWRGHP